MNASTANTTSHSPIRTYFGEEKPRPHLKPMEPSPPGPSAETIPETIYPLEPKVQTGIPKSEEEPERFSLREEMPAPSASPTPNLPSALQGSFLPEERRKKTVFPPDQVRDEALLSFVAEAWHFSRLLRKDLDPASKAPHLVEAFDRLFDRLLDRVEKISPELEKVSSWFKTPEGEIVENQGEAAMFPLLEIAVQKGWTSVLFDPGTQELVTNCLAHWGANGRHELVEKCVSSLAEGLKAEDWEKQVALAHLMDARPWIHQTPLLRKVLDGLNALLASETQPGIYQSALLLAWDLVEPALEASQETAALNLLSILHFHCEEDSSPFPERPHIARHWVFEKSTPQLAVRLVRCAHAAGQLDRYPLLGEKAAPLLLQAFLEAPAEGKKEYFDLFREMREPLQAFLVQKLPEVRTEEELRVLLPALRACGVDTGLSFQLSPWMSKGNRELKLNLIGLIEEINDPAGGASLRVALFDDSEEIASHAARVLGKIRYTPAASLLPRAFEIRKKRFGQEKAFLTTACRALGDLGHPAAIPFLQEIAKKKTILARGSGYSTADRLEAIQAMVKINRPEVWTFMESLVSEKNPELEDAINKIISDRTSAQL